jgi:hypothetical protein
MSDNKDSSTVLSSLIFKINPVQDNNNTNKNNVNNHIQKENNLETNKSKMQQQQHQKHTNSFLNLIKNKLDSMVDEYRHDKNQPNRPSRPDSTESESHSPSSLLLNNTALDNVIINNIKKSFDLADDDENAQPSFSKEKTENILKIAGLLKIRFKETFESIIKANRIEDFEPEQNYRKIKEIHSIKNRFTDTKFKPAASSIYYSSSFYNYLNRNHYCDRSGQIRWKRAKFLVENAQFAVSDHSSNFDRQPVNLNERNYKNFFHTTDLDQGALGNCWFIGAATGIIQNYGLFQRVVPFDNTFEDSQYTGFFLIILFSETFNIILKILIL